MMNVQPQPFAPQTALANLFDYAGLFPPAELSMHDTVDNYLQYQNGNYAWMLNTIVIPASRLREFADISSSLASDTPPVKISVLSSDWSKDHSSVSQFSRHQHHVGTVVSIETRQLDIAAQLGEEFARVYVEIPFSHDVLSNISSIKQAGVCAKLRTGGLTAEAFPSSDQLAEFLLACCRQGVAFKVTAGLHHPLAKVRPTCGKVDAPMASMHGFANLFAAVAKAEQDASLEEIAGVLSLPEDNAKSQFGMPGSWESVSTVRHRFHSIGSCSFEEPLDDLQELGWL